MQIDIGMQTLHKEILYSNILTYFTHFIKLPLSPHIHSVSNDNAIQWSRVSDDVVCQPYY